MIYIYTLSHPITKEVRYVGKTNNIKNRKNSHFNRKNCEKKQTPKDCWILSLLNKNLCPILEVIDETEGQWEWLEQYWISQFKCWGFKLLNLTEGGDVGRTGKLSKEHKQKISASNKKSNRKLTDTQIHDICYLISQKYSFKKIKEKFEFVNESLFYSIKGGHAWKNISHLYLSFNKKNKNNCKKVIETKENETIIYNSISEAAIIKGISFDKMKTLIKKDSSYTLK